MKNNQKGPTINMNPKIRGYHFEVGPFLHKSFRLYANESSFYLN